MWPRIVARKPLGMPESQSCEVGRPALLVLAQSDLADRLSRAAQ
jgi:hypothetical protein